MCAPAIGKPTSMRVSISPAVGLTTRTMTLSRSSAFLTELKEAAARAGIPAIWISPEQASLMQILLKVSGARDFAFTHWPTHDATAHAAYVASLPTAAQRPSGCAR